MRDLYSIGEMVIDFIPGSESGSYIRNAGGAPTNVAIAAARNGLKSGMCCSVGEDDFGHFLYDTLKENSVEILKPGFCKEAITTMAFVTLDENGDRSFTFARKPGADMMLSEEDVKEEEVRNSAIVHAGSCSLSASPEAEATIKAMKVGSEAGRIVSFDVNYRNVMWDDDVEACRDKVLEVLPLVDLMKISDEEAGMFGGEDAIPELMKKNGITLVIETLGSRGARAYFNGEIIDVPGKKATCVDATGAGDAFWGGFLSYLRIQGIEKASDLDADTIRKGMEYGNISGWLCVQSKGAIASLPTRKQIEEQL